jgi:phosphate transport system substrate-binding protein
MKHHPTHLLLAPLALLALFLVTACKKDEPVPGGPPAPGSDLPLSIKGSDTMVTLGQKWAEMYMKKRPSAVIQVTGGGSGTGISALINGTTDICQSSREIKSKEKQLLKQRHDTEGVEIPVARDGLAVYVNKVNKLEELSREQLKKIFTAQITNWKELGGDDAPIIIYSRENSSGTYVYFKEAVLDGADFAPGTQSMPGTASVVNAVSSEKNGIGYGGAAYAAGIKVLKIKKDEATPGVAPTDATVKDGSYPLARPLFFYLVKTPEGKTKTFVDWILSSEGQALVKEVGYYPIN